MILKAAKYALGLVLAFQLAPQCFAQNSIFAKFDTFNCQGAMDREFPNSSAVFSIGLGATNTGTVGIGGGFKATFADIKLVKTLDDCTTQLLTNLSKGTRLKTVTIAIVNPATATAPPTHVLNILLEDVVITGDEFAEAVGGRPSEVVSLFWTKITITHVPSGAKFTWNRLTNSTF